MYYDELKALKNELKYRYYSPRTIESYVRCVRAYFEYLKVNFRAYSESSLKLFLLEKTEAGKSGQTISLYINAIKFFYLEVVKIDQKVNIKHPRRSKYLPIILSRDEIRHLRYGISNLKHRVLVCLAYGAGLRLSEIIKLKIGDLDFQTLSLMVRSGKGRKDRLTLLPENLKFDLRELILNRDSDELLFLSERGGGLCRRTAQKIFKNALQKIGIKKEATFHSLSHSFATHLLENGTDIRYIQKLLGHANIRTTQIYTQVTNIALQGVKSPL